MYSIKLKVFIVYFILIVLLGTLLGGYIYATSQDIVSEATIQSFTNDIETQQEEIYNIFLKANRARDYINSNHYIYELLTNEDMDDVEKYNSIENLRRVYINAYDTLLSYMEGYIYNSYLFIDNNFLIAEKIPSIKVYEGTHGGIYSDAELKGETWFNDLIENGDELSVYQFENDNENLYIIQVLRFFSDIERVIGINVVKINMANLIYKFKEDKIGTYVAIVNNNKYIAGDTAILNGIDTDNIDYIEENIKLSDSHYIIAVNRFFEDIKIVNAMDEQVVMEKSFLLRKIFLIVYAAMIILALILVLWISSALTKPIKKLAGFMETCNFNENTDIVSRRYFKDEIDVLYNSFNIMRVRMQRLIKEQENILSEKNRTEINALQIQINPHFLYNVLNSVSLKSIRSGNNEIAEQLKKVAVLLRHNIKEISKPISLREEVEYLKIYMEIQMNVYGPGLKLHVDIPEELMDIQIFGCILQPIVENSIIHGSAESDYNINIYLTAAQRENILYIYIKDDGIGCDAAAMNNLLKNNTQSESMGSVNVNRRMELIYGNEYGLRYLCTESGTAVEMKFPIEQEGRA